jgi:hypothetical protein
MLKHMYIFGLLTACTEIKVDTESDDLNPDQDNTGETQENQDLYGPDNSWFHTTESMLPEGESCGFGYGDVACNFTMVDQFGDEVELYQFAGKYVVLDLFAEW